MSMSWRKRQSGSSRRKVMTSTRFAASTSSISSPRRTATPVSFGPSAACTAWPNAEMSALIRSARDRSGAPDLLLQLQDAVDQRLGGGRAAGDVDVDRHDAIAAA